MEKFTNIIAESINELGLFDKNKQYIFTVIKPGFLPYAKQIIEKFEKKGYFLLFNIHYFLKRNSFE